MKGNVYQYDINNRQTDEVDVNKEDQGYINEFSRLYAKNKTIDAEIKKINVY